MHTNHHPENPPGDTDHASLHNTLARTRPEDPNTLTHHLLGHDGNRMTLVGIETGGDRAIYYCGFSGAAIAAPFDTQGVHSTGSEVIATDLDCIYAAPQVLGPETFQWVKPSLQA